MKNTTLHTLARRALLPALAALTLLGISAPARADYFLLTLGGADQAINDDAYYLLSSDGFRSDSHLTAQATVLDGLKVGVEWDWATEAHQPADGASTTLDLDSFLATARLEYPARSWLSTYLLAGAGIGVIDLDLELDGADWEQRSYLAEGILLGGLDLHLPTSIMQDWFGFDAQGLARDFTVGLYLELGYRLTNTASFNDLTTPEREEATSTRRPEEATPDPIALADPRFGAVNLSGPLMRAGLVVRF